MPGFDYANARLRAMKSRLLPADTLYSLADESDLPGLLGALSHTPYREAIEMALVKDAGLPALMAALQNDLSGRIRKIQSFFTGKSAELVQLVMLRYDLDNLKSVLRGLSRHLAVDETLAATVPVGTLGTLSAADLTELAQAGNPREAIDLLATWHAPLAKPLLALRVEKPGAALWEMETALEQYYFQEVEANSKAEANALQEYLKLYADCTNITTVVRLVNMKEQSAFLLPKFNADSPIPLFIGPGRMSFHFLMKAAQEDTFQGVISVLASSVYGQPLDLGFQLFQANGRLSSFEKALYRLRLQQALSFFVRDIQGIGILLGYLFFSQNEIINLRCIGQGIYLHRPAVEIRSDLMLVDS